MSDFRASPEGGEQHQERVHRRRRAALRIAMVNAVLFLGGAAGAFFALRGPAGELWAVIGAGIVAGLGILSVSFIILTARSQARDMPQPLFDALTGGEVGTYLCDGDGDVRFANATLLRWLGYDRDQPQARRAIARALARRSDGQRTGGDAIGVRHADGRLVSLHVADQETREGLAWGLVWRNRPFPEAVSAGPASALAATWIRLLEGASVAIVQVDAGGRIVTGNRAFRRIAGRPGAIRPGAFLADIVASEDRRPLIRRLADVGQGGDVDQPLDVRLAGEGDRAATVYFSGLKRTGEAAEGAILHIIDATQRRNLEAQFEQSQKLQAVGQLAGGVAHDFNNILTAITGFCDLLLVRHPPGDPSFGAIMQIRQDATRAAALVRQLLAFSRRQRPRPRVLRLSGTVSDLLALLRRLIGERIELHVRHDKDLGFVRMDQSQIEQIVTNLVLNARDAMPDGGKIRIATFNARVEEPRRTINGVMARGQYVVLEVADEGTGIEEDLAEKIFEPFFTTKEVGRGTGLGLSTVFGIVEQNESFLELESTVGQGTIFRIWLPRLDPSELASLAETAPPATETSSAGAAILLVEDETAVRTFAATALRSRGHRVVEADGPEAALEAMTSAEGPFELLITDVVMPGMSGPELAERVREAAPDMAVIFISGYSEDAAGADVLESANFLPKPFGLDQLASRVAAVLAQARRGAGDV
jgi:two-component system, cell cycle sensor histidine kinase and response regulator CckA